jgi:hypothetical protein
MATTMVTTATIVAMVATAVVATTPRPTITTTVAAMVWTVRLAISWAYHYWARSVIRTTVISPIIGLSGWIVAIIGAVPRA